MTDNEVISRLSDPITGYLISRRCSWAFMKSHGMNEEIEYLKTRFKEYRENETPTEIIWRIKHNVDTIPRCRACGSMLKMNGESYPKSGFCRNCRRTSDIAKNEWLQKHKETCRKRYGVDTPFESKEIRNKAKRSFIEKYGVENPWSSKEIIEKIRQTHIQNLGVPIPIQNDLIKEKIKKTNRERYGCEWVTQSARHKESVRNSLLMHYGVTSPMKSEICKQKAIATFMRHYGVRWNLASKDVREQIAKTMIEKYGYRYPIQSPVIREKTRKTCLERYGTEYVMSTDHFQEASRKTCLERYGYEYPGQVPEIQMKREQTCLERYGFRNPWSSPDVKQKIKLTNIERFGGVSPNCSIDVRMKALETARRNRTISHYKTSYEKIVERLLLSYFGEDDVVYQYIDKDRYPWKCDFYVKSEDLFVEVQGYWTHGHKPYDPEDMETVSLVEQWKEAVKRKKEGMVPGISKYESAIYNYTIRDVEKRRCAKEHSLKYIEIFSNTLSSIKVELDDQLKTLDIFTTK